MINYKRLSGYTKKELWNYIWTELGKSEYLKEKGVTHPKDVSKARLRDIIESTCYKCRKTFDNLLPRRGRRSEPICDECYKKSFKEVINRISKERKQ